jgi:hypothetical protein
MLPYTASPFPKLSWRNHPANHSLGTPPTILLAHRPRLAFCCKMAISLSIGKFLAAVHFPAILGAVPFSLPEAPMKNSLFALLAVVLATGSLLAADDPAKADWKAGLAIAKITPEKPVFLSGYGGRDTPYVKI